MNTCDKPYISSQKKGTNKVSVWREWLWIIIISCLILTLISSPFIVGYLSQTEEKRFSGEIFDRSDISVHLATMRYGLRGEWQYQFRFTSEHQSGHYIKLAYIAMGNLLRLFDYRIKNDLTIPYHIYRFILGFAACLAIYYLMTQSFSTYFNRRLGFLMVVIGGGLGWLQWVIGWQPDPFISPIEFWLIDAFVFFSMFVFPHFLLVLASIVSMIAFFFSYIRTSGAWKIVLIIVLGMLIQTVQPYAIILADLALTGSIFVYLLERKKIITEQSIALGIIGLSQLPLLLYNLWVFQTDPNLIAFSSQNITLSPPPIYLIFGFFFFWPFALLGVILFLRKPRIHSGAAFFWLLGALVLTYLPWGIQRRFLLGFTVPLSILTIEGIDKIFSILKARFPSKPHHLWRMRFAIIFVALIGYSAGYSILGYAINVTKHPAEIYDSASLLEAVDWLAENAPADQIVLSDATIGMLIPVRTDLIAYLGSPFETLDFSNKEKQVSLFFKGELPPDWPYEMGIHWVISKASEITQPSLELVYANDIYTIYQVSRP